MKLDKVTLKHKGWILEEIEDANKPTKVEPEELKPIDLSDQEAIAKREEQIKKIIAKRLEASKKVAEETKGEDHAILSKDIKVKEKLCKDRKEVGVFVEELKAKGIKPFVKKVNEGENRYKVFYKELNESDCDNVDIEALEWYVKNYSEGDNITVTSDLLNVLEQSLEMYKKHCGKEVKEEWEDDKASIQRAKDYWANEVYFQLENIEDLSKDERILNASEEQIKEMANDIAQEIIDDEHLWGEINETIEWYIYHHDYMLANRKDESFNEADIKEDKESKNDESAYEIIVKSFVDFWNDVLSIKETKKGIILNDKETGYVDLYDSWEEICDYEEIIDGDKIYNLSFSEDEKEIVNNLLKKLGKEPLDESINESDVKKEDEIISKETLKKIVDRYDLDEIMSGDLDSQDDSINEIILDCMDEINKDGIEAYTKEWDELYAKVEPVVYAEIRARGYKTESTHCSKKGARKLKEEKEHKGPFEIEYWVDEEARDMGLGDIYLERFDDLEEAKLVADDLFSEVASVEVLDVNGEVVYGRYPEDESCSKKTIKEDVEVARVEYCVMDELDNNLECFDNSEDAINFALENEGVRVLEVSYGPENDFGDEPELGCEEIWSIREDLHEDDKKAPESIEDCQKWVDYDMEHYGKISNNTNEIIKKAGFQILKDDHGDYEVSVGHYEDLDKDKKEKKFAKKVVQPGVQMDDDDMSSSVAFNEAEAHALIGDKPIVEDQKSQIEQANDFSSTVMNSDALKALEDDDNI